MTSRMTRFVLLLLGAMLTLPAAVVTQPDNRDRPANFEGIWNSATATPLERPRELRDKPFFTPAEAAEWERQAQERTAERPRDPAKPPTGTGTYNTF